MDRIVAVRTRWTVAECLSLAALLLCSGCSFYARGPDAYRTAVREVLDAQNGLVGSCYHRELQADPAAKGKVVVKFEVEPKTGNFAKPAVVDAESTASAPLKQCVLTSLEGLKLAPADQRKGEATFAWDFNP